MQGMRYRAIDEHGCVHTGFSSSSNLSELETWIYQRGWQPLPMTVVQRVANGLRIGPSMVRWTKLNAAVFTQNFAQLLLAGLPLLQVLQALIDLETRRPVRRALSDVYCKIDRGESLSSAMATYPGLFGSDYIASIKAGENSGKLAKCLELQAANLQWQSNLTQRFTTVLTYPLFALVSLVVVFLFVLLYLVPAMLPLLSMSTSPMPASTQLLVSCSKFVRHSGAGLFVFTASVLTSMVLVYFCDTPIKHRLQLLMARTRYGQIISAFSMARYARSASLLYESGVDITDAMRISLNMVANSALKKQLADAHAQVLNGISIGAAMQAQQALPKLFVRMVIAGERAGVLGVALRQCAEQMQSNASYSLDRIERLIGPVMLCLLGALMLWVVIAVLGPIYDAVDQAGAIV